MQRRLDIKTDKILELLKEGKKIKEITKIYKCSMSSIQRRIKDLKLDIVRICQCCGKEFLVGPKRLNIYCSIECRNKARQGSSGRWQKEHPLKHKIQRIQIKIRRRKKLIQKLGGKCVNCGITDWRLLQINHINGGGRKERLLLGKKLYTDILKGKREEDYNLLCANCNILYEYDRGQRRDEEWIRKNTSRIKDKQWIEKNIPKTLEVT